MVMIRDDLLETRVLAVFYLLSLTRIASETRNTKRTQLKGNRLRCRPVRFILVVYYGNQGGLMPSVTWKRGF